MAESSGPVLSRFACHMARVIRSARSGKLCGETVCKRSNNWIVPAVTRSSVAAELRVVPKRPSCIAHWLDLTVVVGTHCIMVVNEQ